MMAFSHMLMGVASWGTVATTTGQPMDPTTVAAAFFGSLAPDIDHPRSWLGRRLPFISWPLAGLVGHRGITHSLLAVAAAVSAIVWWPQLGAGLVMAFAVGYLAHLLGDAVTESGIPLFWPLSQRVRLPPAVSVGGLGEVVLLLGFLAVTAPISGFWGFGEVAAFLQGGSL